MSQLRTDSLETVTGQASKSQSPVGPSVRQNVAIWARCGGTVCHPNPWKMEAGGSRGQDHLRLLSEFEANLDYIRPCWKEGREGKEKQKEKARKEGQRRRKTKLEFCLSEIRAEHSSWGALIPLKSSSCFSFFPPHRVCAGVESVASLSTSCIPHHNMHFNVFISPLRSSSPESDPAYTPWLWSTHVHTWALRMCPGPVNHSCRLCMCTTPMNHPHHARAPHFRVLTSGWTQHSRKAAWIGLSTAAAGIGLSTAAVWIDLSTAGLGIFQWLQCTVSVSQHIFKILMLSEPKEKWKST